MVFRAQTYTKIREFSQFADKKNNGKMSYIRCIAENMKNGIVRIDIHDSSGCHDIMVLHEYLTGRILICRTSAQTYCCSFSSCHDNNSENFD